MTDSGSDVDMGEYKPPSRLPEGVSKEVLQEAAKDAWKTPKAGDEVTVEYAGVFEDGSEFDSSAKSGKPAVFTLGKGQVIKGWDVGVATMKKNEKARFTLAPEFAYGEKGSPPQIPPNATLIFTVELVSWIAQDDLFGDGMVTKAVLKDGEGYESPSEGKEVRINLKVVDKDGGVLDEKVGLDYVIGSDALGPLKALVDKTLAGMHKDEHCALRCEPGFLDLPASAAGTVTVEVVLEDVYVINDVSFVKDGSVVKKQLKDGESYEKPADAHRVKLRVEAATDGVGAALPGFKGPTELRFYSGDGDVCDAVECAALDMKKGERALVTCRGSAKCREEKLGLKDLGDLPEVRLVIEMIDFDKSSNFSNWGAEMKVTFAAERKEKATGLFKKERFELALEKYKKVLELCKETKDWPDEFKREAKELTKSSTLNKAMCYLKLGDNLNTVVTCNEILKTDPINAKALFRRAKAHFGRNEFMQANTDLERLLEVDPANREARELLPQVRKLQKKADTESKGAYANMMKAFGKMPSREKKEEPKKEPVPEEPVSDQVLVLFKINYEPKQGEKVLVYGGPEALGAWDPAKAIDLRLHTFQPPPHIHGGRIPAKIYTWEGQAEVPEAEGRTEYQYIIRGPAGDTIEPNKHAVQLGGQGGSRQKCTDSWRG